MARRKKKMRVLFGMMPYPIDEPTAQRARLMGCERPAVWMTRLIGDDIQLPRARTLKRLVERIYRAWEENFGVLVYMVWFNDDEMRVLVDQPAEAQAT